jgi:hypothetical protein
MRRLRPIERYQSLEAGSFKGHAWTWISPADIAGVALSNPTNDEAILDEVFVMQI